MARTVSAGNLANGVALVQDVELAGSEWLSVIGVVGTAATPATAAGDVIVTVRAFLDDSKDAANPQNATIVPINLAVDAVSIANTLVSSRAYLGNRYRVAGLRRVRIAVTNNNVAAMPVEVTFDIQG